MRVTGSRSGTSGSLRRVSFLSASPNCVNRFSSSRAGGASDRQSIRNQRQSASRLDFERVAALCEPLQLLSRGRRQ
jgi:hypothetical protein